MSIYIRPEPRRTYNAALRTWLPDRVEYDAARGDIAAQRVMAAYRAHRRNRSVDTWRAFLTAGDAYDEVKRRADEKAAQRKPARDEWVDPMAEVAK